MAIRPNQGSSDIFHNFKEIKDHSFVSVVRFYESNEKEINQLPLFEYIHLLNEYLNALFELSKYKKYIDRSEVMLYASIEYNINSFRGEDVYAKCLLRRAACYYHLYQTDSSKKILYELLKMDSSDQASRLLMEKCLLRENRNTINISRALVVCGFLLAASVVAIELFIIKPFYPENVVMIEILRNGIFIFSIAIFLFGEVLQRGMTRYRLLRSIEKLNDEKSRRN